jgi:type II secretory pathway component GspD/PulD (secretin)
MRQTLLWLAAVFLVASTTAACGDLNAQPPAESNDTATGHPPRVRLEVLVVQAELTNTERLLLANLGRHSLPSDAGGFAATGSADTFSLLIRDLEIKNKVQFVSTPRIIAGNNETVRLVFGTPVKLNFQADPYPTKNRDIYGIYVQLTPKINADGTVGLRVLPEVTSAQGKKFEICNGSPLGTVYNLKSLDTTVFIPSGESVVLGGAFEEYDNTTEHKIPLLSDLPWVGSAFTRNTHEKQKTDLLIVITPHLEKAE